MCIIWAFIDGKPDFVLANYITNIIEFNCMGFCGYFWLCYCLNHVDMPALKTKKAKILIIMPILIVMLLIITTPLTHWMFYIDENGCFQRGTFYLIQQTGYLYLGISLAICLTHRKKCATSSARRRLNILSLFPLSPILFGGIQIIAPSGLIPTLQFSILISLILVFVDELEQKITRDSLTQLKNRYEFERILQNKMHSFKQTNLKLYVLVSDLDHFKSINDNYGHSQGDAALITVGQVITTVTERYNAICARMSGDEFVSLIETDSPKDVSSYQDEVEKGLKEISTQLPYTLRISTGAAEYDGTMSLMELLNQADIKMYEQKKLHKHTR